MFPFSKAGALLALACLPLLAWPTEGAPPSLTRAFSAAWSRSPQAQAQPARLAALHAQQEVAAHWLAAPPAVTLSHRSDRLSRNQGLREWEAELALPLALPDARAADVSLAGAEIRAWQARQAVEQLELAGEVREAVWALRVAEVDLQVAQRQVQEAQTLADDVSRRVRAGDLARTDEHQAHAALVMAKAGQGQAQLQLMRARRAYEVLTGMAEAPVDGEAELAPEEQGALDRAADGHLRVQAAQAAVTRARAQWDLTRQSVREGPELAVGVSRERDAFGERASTTARVAVRLPLGSQARQAPRLAAAQAELLEAEGLVAVERLRVAADMAGARAELVQARQAEQLAAERDGLMRETHRLLAKAFALGEIDLPARLRAESERAAADLALSRARIESLRALSRFHQAAGRLP